MESRQRVEWYQVVAGLMTAQRDTLVARDAEGFLHATDRLQALCAAPPPLLDSPPDPIERAWLRNLARMNRSNARLLLSLTEPLRELDTLARETGHAVALDCCA